MNVAIMTAAPRGETGKLLAEFRMDAVPRAGEVISFVDHQSNNTLMFRVAHVQWRLPEHVILSVVPM